MAQQSNEQILDAKKAQITTDQLAAAGKLNPVQASTFIDYIIDETALKGHVRVEKFRSESMIIDKVGVPSRVAMPAAEARDPGSRRGIATSKITLTPVEIMVPFEISENFFEINVEGASAEDHVMRMMATACANNVEELQIVGDTNGVAALESELYEGGSLTQYIKDSFLALFNGFLRLAELGGNAYDAEGKNIGTKALGEMKRKMPTKFQKDPRKLRYFFPTNQEQVYREAVGARATPKGDEAINSSSPMTPWGIPLVPIALMPEAPRKVKHVQLTGTAAVSLGFSNITNVVVTKSTLGNALENAYTESTNGSNNDYVVDYEAGTIARSSGSPTITSGQVVKVTFDCPPQGILTTDQNLVVGIGRDITIGKDVEIFKRVRQYAITLKIAVAIQEASALVFGHNFGRGY